MEGRTAVHFDRVVGVVGEDEHRRVVRRLVPPPSTPFLVPLAANGTEHVASHDIRAAPLEQVIASALVRLVARLARVKMPLVQSQAADSKRVLTTLVRTRDEAVKGD